MQESKAKLPLPIRVRHTPLAARMRPRNLDEFHGQEHILGPGRLLRRAIQGDQLSSVLLYGPPGVGKTTLAQIIANTTKAQFIAINAVLAGIKDIREAIDTALDLREQGGRRTVLFIDEVHRFNKSQQDALLPHVENGTFILIGATTENPYFEVNKALVSRSRIFAMKALGDKDVTATLHAAIADADRGYGSLKVHLHTGAIEHLTRMAAGDARSALNALELAVTTTDADSEGVIQITLSVAEESIQKRSVLYDKDGDAHYDTISAFIKSVRGSDPDAALYWLARMVTAGEDPRFLFRRMLILASEDIGLADPNALRVVMSAAQAFDYVGLPEGQFHLAEACLYLSNAPKRNSSFAFFEAMKAVEAEGHDDPPDTIKDASRDAADLGHGKGYLYPHAFRDHWVAQQYLPEGLQGKVFYQPTDQGFESSLRDTVQRHREAQWEAARRPTDTGEELFLSPGVRKTLRGGWLERASGTGSEVLRAVRDHLFDKSSVSRDSLVLDLNGATGFLTWEALRRARGGGVWTRCESETEKNNLLAFAAKLELFSRPVIKVASLYNVTDICQDEVDAPRFDSIIGLDLSVPKDGFGAWIITLSQLLSQTGKIVLAFKIPGVAQPIESLFPKNISKPAWCEAVLAEQAKTTHENWNERALALGKMLNQSLSPTEAGVSPSPKEWQVAAETRAWGYSRRFTPGQADSMLSAAEGFFAQVKKRIGEEEWPMARRILFNSLSTQDGHWRQGFVFLTLSKA